MAKTVRLHEFCAYIGQQKRAIREVYAEIEEVQRQFNEIYKRTLESWKAAISGAVPLLTSEVELPPTLAQGLLKVTAEERAKLEREVAELAAQIEQLRNEADSAITEAQAEMAALRQTNPQLDAQEEELKARCTSIRDSLTQIEARIRATGWLTGIRQRYRLRKERAAQREAHASAVAELRRVRQSWEDEKKRFAANQTRLREKWEAAGIKAAELQARHDYLQSNLERLSSESGAARFLAELKSVPDSPKPLHAVLEGIVELYRSKATYEDGLRAVAEGLGLLNGLAEGMERFQRSADKVLEEQRQYNLAELRLRLSDEVLGFHALWPEFRAQMRDEKVLGKHPVEFSRTVRAIIRDHLAEQSIASTFESMGDALTRATKAWD